MIIGRLVRGGLSFSPSNERLVYKKTTRIKNGFFEVAVRGCCGGRKIWVDRRGHRIDIKEVTYEWTSAFDEDTLRHFSVSDAAGNLYELILNVRTFQWTFNFGK